MQFFAPGLLGALLVAGCGGGGRDPVVLANRYVGLSVTGDAAGQYALLLPALRRLEPKPDFLDVARRARLRRSLVKFELLNKPKAAPSDPWRALFRMTWDAHGRKESSWQGVTLVRRGGAWWVEDAPAARQEAAEAYAAGEFARATRILQRVIRANPADAESLDLLGYVMRDNPALKNNLEMALDAHGRAVEREPGNPDWRLSLGNDYRLLGWHEGAVAELKRAIAIDARANYYVWLGLAYASGRQLDEARAAWHHAIKLDPQSAQAHAFLEKLK